MNKTVILFLMFSTSFLAQTIKGTVLDHHTELPIKNVNVLLKGSQLGDVTNREGEFKIKMNSSIKRTDTLVLSYVGYQHKELSIIDFEKLGNTISISENIQNLETVVVSSKNKLRDHVAFVELASLEKGLFGFGAELIDDKIVLIGGNSTYFKDEARETLGIDRYANPNASLIDILNQAYFDFHTRIIANHITLIIFH